MGDVTPDGERLIKWWLGAQEHLDRARRELSGAECDLRNAECELAKWLLPEDAKPGEKIAVWYGDSLIQAEAGQALGDAKVTIRKRGRRLHG